jgi:solute carrier family 13 (sodium-dependent dicarboxylate transporter), member 2/3/5
MMLPVGMTLITLTSGDPKKTRNVAAILLFSISYGCSIAGIATPSGGARNIIIINYWHQFFYDVTDPATYRYLVDYITWIIYAFPMFLLRLPIVTLLLLWTFKPETTDLSRAVARLRAQVEMEGPIKPSDWLTFLLFGITIVAWITLSGTLGLGVVAIGGALLFLVTGLVRWEDINTGVNWGVVLLYAAAVSLGLEMQESGAAQWLAQSMLRFLHEVGAASGASLYAAISLLTIAVSNTMTAGAAVAVLGPVVLKAAQVSGSDPLAIGFLTAISSAFGYLTAAAQPAFAIIYASGYLRPKDFWKIGWKMMLVSYVLLLILAEFYWPLIAAPQGI